MQQYLQLLGRIRKEGVLRQDRTSTGTYSVFGHQMRFDLEEGFPLLTTKKLHLKSIIYELLWFLRGDTNIKYLNDNGVRIWNEWADENGDLGPVYGSQWRSWQGADGKTYDQVETLLSNLKSAPYSRRHIISAWNVAELEKMALPPCHAFMQFYVADNRLSCMLTQRSVDTFLGLPFNIASYSLLTHMIAQQAGLGVGEFIWSGGDCHLYLNHLDQAEEQLRRKPLPLPSLKLNKAPSLFEYKYEDFVIENYNAHPHIKAEISV